MESDRPQNSEISDTSDAWLELKRAIANLRLIVRYAQVDDLRALKMYEEILDLEIERAVKLLELLEDSRYGNARRRWNGRGPGVDTDTEPDDADRYVVVAPTGDLNDGDADHPA